VVADWIYFFVGVYGHLLLAASVPQGHDSMQAPASVDREMLRRCELLQLVWPNAVVTCFSPHLMLLLLTCPEKQLGLNQEPQTNSLAGKWQKYISI
jgi:hypothetical protein